MFAGQVPAVTGLRAFVPRAALTVPRIFLHLAYSHIPGAGIGVFSTLTLPSGVRFGPYRGRRLKTLNDRNNRPSHVVDASDGNNSNWMRYVNCARRYSEQNLVAFQYQGDLYYRTVKIVPRFTELLVFYGSEFANRLGVDLRRYTKPCDCEYCQGGLGTKNEPEKIDKGKTANEKKKEAEIKDVSSGQATLVTEKGPAKTNKRKTRNEKKEDTQIKDVTKGSQVEQLQEPSSSQAESPKSVDVQEIPPTKPAVDGSPNTTVSNVNIYKCDQCGKTFDIKSELEKHLQSHIPLKIANSLNTVKEFTCKKCSSTFDTRLLLLEHGKSRHGVKYFTCSECEYATSHKGNLQTHLRTHSGERPFKCSQCSAAFTQSSDLQRHKRTHTGDKPFKCGQCSAAFTESGNLQTHKRTHTGDKPFKCGQCSAAFTHSSDLQRHKRTHTGEKPFECNICDYRASESCNLKRHLMLRHSGQKPNGCDSCTYRSATRSQLSRHMKTHRKPA
ncbi:histone-lysine N-methyltransferase PRDM9-like [Cydia fagiglandana]|uniref:histone-lysine N-methyltransferase PRDM9-like n=1 Tax=Cydia fagiglandana TaxID=1458189 RepID=UPI002FEE2753